MLSELVLIHVYPDSVRISYLGNMKLSLDTMGVLRIVLFIFEAVLLIDCARGECNFTMTHQKPSFLLILHLVILYNLS